MPNACKVCGTKLCPGFDFCGGEKGLYCEKTACQCCGARAVVHKLKWCRKCLDKKDYTTVCIFGCAQCGGNVFKLFSELPLPQGTVVKCRKCTAYDERLLERTIAYESDRAHARSRRRFELPTDSQDFPTQDERLAFTGRA